jgi:hypothetical protein
MRTFLSLIYVFVNVLFFTSWASNLTCTSCRTYTLECGHPNMGKFVNCLAALCPLNDKLLACIACRNILDWTNDWHSPHLQLADQWEWNRRRSVLPGILSFSRLVSTLFILNFREYWRHFSVHLSPIDICFQFTFGFHSALHLTYSFHIRQIFLFLFYLVCKVYRNLDYTLPRRTYLLTPWNTVLLES